MPSSSHISNKEEHSKRNGNEQKLDGANVAPEIEVDDFGLPVRRPMSAPKAHLPQRSGGSQSAKRVVAELQPEEQTVQSTPASLAGDLPKPPLDSSKEPEKDDHVKSNVESDIAQTMHDPKVNAEQQPFEVALKTLGATKNADGHKINAPNPSDLAAENQEEIVTANDTKTGPQPVELKEVIKGQADNAPALGHRRGQSSTGAGISEWSHQHLAPKDVVEEEVEEDQWQTMPAYAPYDIYDDNNKLVAREANESEDEAADGGLGGAGKGYTRVQLDEDAQSATSMDENTQYLFKDVNGTSAAGPDDDEARDALSQMKATKDLLTEGQRIAYVGMTRLALSDMLKQCEAMSNKTKGSKKEAALGAEAMKMWGQKMMVRLYSHMDISSAEQVMIEQLAEHGVVPKDLTPTLMQNSRVKNPMAEKDEKDAYTNQVSLRHASESPTKNSRDSMSSLPEEEDLASPPPPYVEHEGDDLPAVRTPSQLPTSKNIDIDLRWTVLCDLFLTLIADSIYDARSRVLLERVGQHMDVSWTEICRFEKRVTDALEMQQAAEKENWNEDEHKETRRKQALKKRYMYMGLATVGGSLVIGLSAGLLAPVIGAGLAAGFTTIGVAGTGGFLAGAGGAAVITSTAAASGGVIAVRAANRRTGAVKTFEYRPLHNNKRVNLIVTVSGWMTGKVDDVRLPYSTVDPVMGDIYSVLWEPEMLTSMGDTINILATEALTQGLQQVLGSTILVGLMAALQLPVVLTKLSYLIDNPWTVSLDRANSAGLILADSLMDRNLGTRPITLVGYSLGSRMIFSCLKELAKRAAFGIVQNVYLFGSPIVANKDEYLKARTVVAGHFINGYAKNDWILGYLFRLTSGGISRVAGLAPIEDIPGLENIDVTSHVPGHMSYRKAMPKLLQEVGFLVESLEFTEIEDPDPENHEKRQRELIDEIEEARKELEEKEKEKTKGIKGAFGIFSRKRKTAPKKKEWETYQESKEHHDEKIEDTHEGSRSLFFDVEAIRRELAIENMEVRELPSTLPPMRLDEHLEVKELESTLPPIKLSLESPMTSPRPSLRETKTYDSSIVINSGSSITGSVPLAPRLSNDKPHNIDNPSISPSNTNLHEDDIQMTFDVAYRSPDPSPDSFPKPTSAPQPSPPVASPVDGSAAIQRPGLKSSVTTPALGLSLEHNAWADDSEDFKEKEMEMTFA